jgi:hypothetical protein
VSIANGKVVAYLVVAANVVQLSGAFVDDPAASLPPALTVNAQVGTTYAFTLADGDGRTIVTFANGGPVEVTVPANATVALPVGTILEGAQLGAGLVTTIGETGVTINGVTPGDVDSAGQYAAWRLVKLATDTWLMAGDIV